MRFQSLSSLLSGVALLGLGAAACGDDNPAKIDSGMPIDARMVDAGPDAYVEPPINLLANEGGEIRLEWIQKNGGTPTSRMGAYFYKSQTPARFDLPAFPGCFDVSARDKWPLAQGTIVPLDVGGVIIGTSQNDTTLTRVPATGVSTPPLTGPNVDAFGRTHSLWWSRVSAVTVGVADMDLPNDEYYDVILTGGADWPAQAFPKAAFMPKAWAPIAPAFADNTPTTDTAHFLADQDYTWTYTPVTSANIKPGDRVNTVIAFTVTGQAAGPHVLCQEEGTDGSITVPAALIAKLRAYPASGVGATVANGTYVRQQLVHKVFELTDGTPRATADRKRVDVLSIYCYNSTWRAGAGL